MNLFRVSDFRSVQTPLYESARQTLVAGMEKISNFDAFHIFLSHSFLDADDVLKIKSYFESTGLRVYVDWTEDPQLDRKNVTPQTAARIKSRMQRCQSLIYLYSLNGRRSVWMPWELGCMDGMQNKKIAIMPLIPDGAPNATYDGQEYLGLYPYIENIGGVPKVILNQVTQKDIPSWLVS